MSRRLHLLFALTLLVTPVFAEEEVLSARLVTDATAVQAGQTLALELHLELRPGWHVYPKHRTTNDLEPITAKVEGPPGTVFEPLIWPLGRMTPIASFNRTLPLYEGRVVVRGRATLPPTLPEQASVRFRATIHYQACSDSACYLPTDLTASLDVPMSRRPVAGHSRPSVQPSAGIPTPLPSVGTGLLPSVSQTKPAASDNPVRLWLESYGLIVTLIFIFVGGLALNLTPCVWPMIPITVSFFVAQSGKRGGLALPVAYLLGMSVTYSAMGVIAALMGGLLGGALQSTPVVLLISGVFVALALSMFGLYEIRPPGFITDRFGAREGILGAFLMGLMVGLVAAPCVGPVVAGLMIVVAEQGSVWFGFLTFFILSLGLGLPFLILGASTDRLAHLPAAGVWMESVRRLFGVILLLMALYYVDGLIPSSVVRGLVGIVLITTGVALGAFEPGDGAGHGADEKGFWSGLFRRSSGLVLVLTGGALFLGSLVLCGLVGPTIAPAGSASSHGIEWSIDASILDRPGGPGQPVMVDFFSDRWCAACRELEHKTYPDPAVVAASRRLVNLRIDVDNHPQRADLISRFGVRGVPVIAFVDSTGKEVAGSRINGFVPPTELLARITMVK